MKIELNKIKDTDVSFLKLYYPEKYDSLKFNEMNAGSEQGQHYKLLFYLSSLFKDELILDLGTRDGLSALTLSYNSNNQVISYDLLPMPEEMINYTKQIDNCNFKQMNCLDEDLEIYKKAKLIFLDLDPHDGIQEQKFIQILESINYKGIVICDDIVWFPQMREWWDNLKQTKYDLTNWAHGSGTGLIDFSGDVEIL